MRVKTVAEKEVLKCKRTVSFKDLKSRTKQQAKRIVQDEEKEEGEVTDDESGRFSPNVPVKTLPFSPTVKGKLEDDDLPQTQAWPSDEEAFETGKGADEDANKENEEPNVVRFMPFVGDDWVQSDLQAQPY